jgi:hypothetical protein
MSTECLVCLEQCNRTDTDRMLPCIYNCPPPCACRPPVCGVCSASMGAYQSVAPPTGSPPPSGRSCCWCVLAAVCAGLLAGIVYEWGLI